MVEFDPYDARREEADGRSDLAAARARIEKAESEGGKNEKSLTLDRDVAKDELDRAETFKLTDEGLFSRHQIIESRLDRDLFARRAEVAGEKLDQTGKLSAAERALGEIDAGKARLKIEIAEKGLRSLRITAPHDGLLVLERNWRGEVTFVGDTLWPGQKIAELPDLGSLQARVFVLEADGAGLKPGLPARVSIEGQPGREHEAKVSRVEPLAKTRDYQSPVKYFEVVLALGRTEPETMKPGQKVRAVIRMDEADGVLAVPRGAIFDKDGRRVVYRREGGDFTPVEVTIGRQSISRAVVDAGLSGGRPHRPARPDGEGLAGLRLGRRDERGLTVIDPREALASGLESLRHHALRSFLAMLGIIFGVGAVIAMLSIGAGAEKQALEIIDAMGLRNVVVKDKRFDRENEQQEIRRKSVGLSSRDAQAIRDAVPGVERVVAKIEVEAWKVLSPLGNRAKPRVLGVSSDYPQLVKLPLREGRFFDERDEQEHAPVCVIGDRVRRELFGFEPALGRPLKINDQWLTVVGMLAPGGGKREIQGVTLEGTANDVYLPVTAGRAAVRPRAAQGAARRAGREHVPGHAGAGVGGRGGRAPRPPARRGRRLHDHRARGAARAEPAHAAAVRHRDGRRSPGSRCWWAGSAS